MAPKKQAKPDVDPALPDVAEVKSDDSPAVVSVKGPDGRTRYAWRKDGVKPVINMDDFVLNIHSALDGTPGADFADHVGPQ